MAHNNPLKPIPRTRLKRQQCEWRFFSIEPPTSKLPFDEFQLITPAQCVQAINYTFLEGGYIELYLQEVGSLVNENSKTEVVLSRDININEQAWAEYHSNTYKEPAENAEPTLGLDGKVTCETPLIGLVFRNGMYEGYGLGEMGTQAIAAYCEQFRDELYFGSAYEFELKCGQWLNFFTKALDLANWLNKSEMSL